MSRRPPQPDPDLHDLLEYLRRDVDSYARMDERVEVLETNYGKLERILLEGTGEQAAIIHQVLENKLNLKTLTETVASNDARITNTMRQRIQGNTAIIIALISAIASLIAAYISISHK